MEVVLALAGLVVLLLAVMLIRALMLRPDNSEGIKKSEVKLQSKDAAKHLSDAIKFKTVSNVDTEKTNWKEFDNFRGYLVKTYPKIHEVMTREIISDYSLMYKWEGKDKNKKPIALIAHMDVVPVTHGTEDDWTNGAFSGHIDDKYIWGRGTLDMKNILIALCEAVEQLITQGYEPECDIYLCFGHNEEVVGAVGSGAQAICDTLENRGVKLGMVVDEGGFIVPGTMFNIPQGDLAVIGISEKGYVDIKVTSNKSGGHSSQPPKDNGLVDLAKILVKLDKNQMKQRMTYTIKHLFLNTGKHMSFGMKFLVSNMWITTPLVLKALSKSRVTNAMIRTTITPTMAEGSPAVNVLPQTAHVNINSRILQGEKIEDVINHIKKCAGKTKIDIEVERGKEPSAISSIDSVEYNLLKRTIREVNGKIPVAPYLMIGGTDSSYYENICDNIFRVGPLKVTEEDIGTIHSTNEKIAIEEFHNSIKFYIQLIYNYCDK